MTDIQETQAVSEGGQTSAPAIGPSLKEAREARGLSVEDVASHLRLSTRQIHALENDEFSALPESTITRGFIRNYARLLEINSEPLLDTYRAYSPTGTPKAITIQSANILISGGDRRPWLAYISASVVIAALLGAWLLYFEHPQTPPAGEAQPAPPVAAEQESQAVTEPLPIAALPAAEREASQSTEEVQNQATAPVSIPPAEAAAAPAAPNTTTAVPQAAAKDLSTISMRFAEQSWVSVTDRDNKEILNKNKPAGSDEDIEGRKPLKLVIGNAAGTTLTYNGKVIDLAPYTKLNVARLTLE
jgi:cytoskeleton protein RodZ